MNEQGSDAWSGLLHTTQGRQLLDRLDGGISREAVKAALQEVTTWATYWQPQHHVPQDEAGLARVLDECLVQGVFDVLDWEWNPEEQWWAYHRPWEGQAFYGREQWYAWRGEMAALEAQAGEWDGPVSACWWSTPPVAETAPMTWLRDAEEDSFGPDELWTRMVVWEGTKPLRRYEIDSAEDYVQLVARYPLEMSAYRRWDWGESTGAKGRLFSPDFAAMAQDWDAVTVTPRGYLLSATQALDVPGIEDAQAVMAGWHPGRTWWLTDRVRVSETELRWVRVEEEPVNHTVKSAWEPRDTRG